MQDRQVEARRCPPQRRSWRKRWEVVVSNNRYGPSWTAYYGATRAGAVRKVRADWRRVL